MGIDYHGLYFLKYCRKYGPFGQTAMIGRQGVHLIPHRVRHIMGIKKYQHHPYAEHLLQMQFGANMVDSFDNSAYENATIIHDMNEPLAEQFYGQYDTIIDMGSLEHVYNLPQAFQNLAHILKPGGQIIHVLPANNFCGHGFWQFTPELFYSLYSLQNGFLYTEVFLANHADFTNWYKAKQPDNGVRVEIYSRREVYALVRTKYEQPMGPLKNVQQSDYLVRWNEKNTHTSHSNEPKTSPFTAWLMEKINQSDALAMEWSKWNYDKWHRRHMAEHQMNARNAGLTVCKIKDIVK